MFTPAQKGSIPPTPSIHRLQYGLPGYLILFAPHAFAPQRQLRPSKSPSPLVFLPISTHFTATLGIPLTSSALKLYSLQSNSHLESRTFTPDLYRRLHALYAQSFRTTLAPYVLPRLLARSWPGLLLQVPSISFLSKAVYNPKAFFPHAALLRQAFAHCAKFPAAASRRSLGRVSVPVWLIVLSDQLPVEALVSHYLTNKLIGRETLPKR